MTTEPKLFTLAEAQDRFGDAFNAELRERGLIAEEPVDPLLVEAREICAKQAEGNGAHNWAIECRAGECDTSDEVECAMIALRRGMELAPRKELTREMVLKAHWHATGAETVEANLIDRLHAALTKEPDA